MLNEAPVTIEALAEKFANAAELDRRWNAFEPGGEVERLRAAVERAIAVETSVTTRHEMELRDGYLVMLRAALAQEPAHAKA